MPKQCNDFNFVDTEMYSEIVGSVSLYAREEEGVEAVDGGGEISLELVECIPYICFLDLIG